MSEPAQPNSPSAPSPGAAPLTEDVVREALRQVIDPEIDCNIVDLGLVYDIAVRGTSIAVKMTLTTPGCPLHETIAWGVKSALLQLDTVENVEVELVWDPPWQPAMMSDFARAQLGISS